MIKTRARRVVDESTVGRMREVLTPVVVYRQSGVDILQAAIKSEFGLSVPSAQVLWTVQHGRARLVLGLELGVRDKNGIREFALFGLTGTEREQRVIAANMVTARRVHETLREAIAPLPGASATLLLTPPFGLSTDQDSVFRIAGLNALIEYVAGTT